MRRINITLEMNGKKIIHSFLYHLDSDAQTKLDMCANKDKFLTDIDEYMVKSFKNGLQKAMDDRMIEYNKTH